MALVQLELVAGELAPPGAALGGDHEDPNTGEAMAPRLASTDDAVERALATSFASWEERDGPVEERARMLGRLADQVDARAEQIAVAEALDTGVPISVTRMIARSLGDTIRSIAALAGETLAPRRLDAGGRRVEQLRPPWGPAALLVPWNAPAPTAVGKIANALAAGCPAILKPSEHAVAACSLIAEAAVAAGLAAGALQVVHGDGRLGAQLAADPRIRAIALTGGQASGRAVAAAAAPRMAALRLELGGTNPAVVTADADVEAAADALVRGMTKLSGQWCEAPRRVLVAAELHDALRDALAARAAMVRIGSSLDAATELGPIGNRPHFERVCAQLGRVARSDGGFFVAPAIVAGSPHEELFAPVLALHPVANDEEAIEAANAPGDGLAAYVFAGDDERALALARRLHAGEVRIDGTGLLDLAPAAEQSFWGSSGTGAHGRHNALTFFTGARVVGVDDPAAPI
jgi:betaine-aldehyde dehydrogenase